MKIFSVRSWGNLTFMPTALDPLPGKQFVKIYIHTQKFESRTPMERNIPWVGTSNAFISVHTLKFS
jgi:hypothetical protein